MAKGLVNREIGEVLGIAPATVKRHVSAVIEALDVTNRTEAANALHELGLGQSARDDGAAVEGFGTRPAIAVLPFDDFSTDPEHRFLADGVVEDLTTRLARWRWFPVIARNTMFQYKGKPVDMKAVSRELGARYLIEGSVRAAAGRVRITVQLVDGESGQHVMAERFDRELADLFETLDEIVDTLVMRLEPALVSIEGVRAMTRMPESLDVWECLGRGFAHLTRYSWDEFEQARELFERARELEPELSLGHTGVAFTLVGAIGFQRAADIEATARSSVQIASHAVSLDPGDAVGLATLAWAHLVALDPNSALDSVERALLQDPSLAWAHAIRGAALVATASENAPAAQRATETAMRLSPNDPFRSFFLGLLAHTRTLQGDFAGGLAIHEQRQRLSPDEPGVYPGLAASYVWVGRNDDARSALERMRALAPDFSAIESIRPYVDAPALEAMQNGLAFVGWEEPKPS